MVDFIAVPAEYIDRILLAFDTHENFRPSNEGFIYFFLLFMYPVIWNISNWYGTALLMVIPIISFFYVIDPALWNETVTTIDSNYPGKTVKLEKPNSHYPTKGLAMVCSEYF